MTWEAVAILHKTLKVFSLYSTMSKGNTKTITPLIVKDTTEEHFFSIIMVTIKNQEHQINLLCYKNSTQQ